jgi:hypothetical protein
LDVVAVVANAIAKMVRISGARADSHEVTGAIVRSLQARIFPGRFRNNQDVE